jgi:hypothetical protein
VRNQLVKFDPSVFSLSLSRNDPKLNEGRGAAIYNGYLQNTYLDFVHNWSSILINSKTPT